MYESGGEGDQASSLTRVLSRYLRDLFQPIQSVAYDERLHTQRHWSILNKTAGQSRFADMEKLGHQGSTVYIDAEIHKTK